jgi:hypothetical protein
MRKTIAVFIVMTTAVWCFSTVANAQGKDTAPDQPKTAGQDSKPQADRSNAVVTPYRLDFSFYELQDGKKINTRHFSLDLTAGSGNDIKIGTRVPVATGQNVPNDPSFNFQYMDVGTRIWANLAVLGGGDLRLDVKSDVSNLDLTAEHDRNPGAPPIVRQIQINGSTLLVTGKPILIGSMDDPNSNREFQLEVTATKLR